MYKNIYCLSACGATVQGETDIKEVHKQEKLAVIIAAIINRECLLLGDVPTLPLLSLFCDFPDTIQEGLIPKVSGLKAFHAHTGWESRKALCSSASYSTSKRSRPQLLIARSKLHSVWGETRDPQQPCHSTELL